jgi:hypothetical protein
LESKVRIYTISTKQFQDFKTTSPDPFGDSALGKAFDAQGKAFGAIIDYIRQIEPRLKDLAGYSSLQYAPSSVSKQQFDFVTPEEMKKMKPLSSGTLYR